MRKNTEDLDKLMSMIDSGKITDRNSREYEKEFPTLRQARYVVGGISILFYAWVIFTTVYFIIN